MGKMHRLEEYDNNYKSLPIRSIQNMIKSRLIFLYLLIVAVMLLFLSGCIEMDLDITINQNGNGKAIMAIAATDQIYNEFVDEMIADVLRKDPQAKIKERYHDSKKVADIELSFQNVSELSTQGFHISHNHYDNKHFVEIGAIQGVPVTVTLNMPGRIIQSNGSYSGSRVTWEKAYMTDVYWAESEVSGTGGMTIFFFIILAVIILFAMWYFLNRNKGVVQGVYGTNKPDNFCTNCGSSIGLEDNFCMRCGAKRE